MAASRTDDQSKSEGGPAYGNELVVADRQIVRQLVAYLPYRTIFQL